MVVNFLSQSANQQNQLTVFLLKRPLIPHKMGVVCLFILLTSSQVVISSDFVPLVGGPSTGWDGIPWQIEEARRGQTTEALTTTSEGFGKTEPFMSLNYLNSFRISVYNRGENVYPYSPALILDPASAQSSFNRLTKKHEVTFSVLMWDELLEDFVQSEVSRKTEITSPVVRVLPIQQIRLKSAGHTADYSFVDKWQPYYNQPSFFEFRVNCLNQAKCDQLASDIKTSPKQAVQDFTVYFTLDQPQSSEMKIQLKNEHVLESEIWTKLVRKMPSSEVVIMTPDNLRRMLTEIANEAVKTEAAEGQFISQDQIPSIVRALENALKAEVISTADLDTNAWKSVFWGDETKQPDAITRTLNQLYNESSASMREAIKNEFKSTKIVLNHPVVALRNFITAENENIIGLVIEAKNMSSWDGEKFVITPIQMWRVNLTAFRSDETIAAVRVKVWSCSVEPGYRINVLLNTQNETSLSGRNELQRLQQRLTDELNQVKTRLSEMATPPTGTIQMIYSRNVPAGWLACNGAAINCSQYNVLCDLVGSFTPNFQGRFPVGLNGTDLQKLGSVGGEAEHLLTVSEMPVHSHGYVEMSSVTTNVEVSSYAGGTDLSGSGRALGTSYAAGGSQPHNNLPPYLVVSFIIKT